jgi:hypothetical protein
MLCSANVVERKMQCSSRDASGIATSFTAKEFSESGMSKSARLRVTANAYERTRTIACQCAAMPGTVIVFRMQTHAPRSLGALSSL